MCYDERLTRVDVAGYSGENRRLASAKHEMAKARQTLHDVTMRAEVVNSDIARIAGAPAGSFKDDAAAIADLREDVFQAMDNLNVAEAHHSAAKAMQIVDISIASLPIHQSDTNICQPNAYP